MLSNLKAEMARYDVSINDIAVVVGKSYRTISEFRSGHELSGQAYECGKEHGRYPGAGGNRGITVTSAYGGTGTVDADKLAEQMGLADARYKLVLLGEEDDQTGIVIQVQVNNREVSEEYELNQVGIYAKLDADRNPDAEAATSSIPSSSAAPCT